MRIAIVAALVTLSSSAFAQTTAPTTTQPAATPAAATPTSAQCTAGWKSDMAWTQDQFTKACAKFKSVN